MDPGEEQVRGTTRTATSPDPTVVRDRLFVSYSHADSEWLQRFEVLLKPLVRRRRLFLWADRSLRAGDAWSDRIEEAIARSRVALLLVSADFLASDFIMNRELPMLLEHGVRLAPVLVGDCLWREDPVLAVWGARTRQRC